MTDKAKLSFSFLDSGSSLQRRTPLLVRDAHLQVHQSGFSDRVLEVDQGRYYISTRLADGGEQILAGPIDVFPGYQTVRLSAQGLEDIDQQHVTPALQADVQLPLSSDQFIKAASQFTIPVVPWQGRWLSHWIEMAEQDSLEVSVPATRQAYTLDVPQIIIPPTRDLKDDFLLALDEGRDGRMTFFAVPFDGPVWESCWRPTNVTVTRKTPSLNNRQAKCHEIAFAFEDPDVTKFLQYVREGFVREAATFSREAIDAARMELHDKNDSPLGAIIGAYVLLRANVLEGLDEATVNLMRIAPYFPDVLPLRVEFLARTARHYDAVTELQRAQEFGCPWSRSGIFYLLSRAKHYLNIDGTAALGLTWRARGEIAALAGGLELLATYLDPNYTVATYRDVPIALIGV